MRTGLRETRWPGRLEVIAQDPLTVIDVGHTPDGIRQSLAGLKQIHGAERLDSRRSAFPATRRSTEIAGALAPSFDTIICTSAHHKGGDARSARSTHARNANPHADVEVAATIEQAVRASRTLAARAQSKNLCRRRPVHWRSNMPPPHAGWTPKIWNFSEADQGLLRA